MDIEYRDRISASEMNALRKGIGFRQIHQEQLSAGLAGSARIAAAYHGEQAVGMARLLWDGGATALITDVIVLPEYRGQGMEERLVESLLGFLRDQLRPGYGIQVDVKAWQGQAAFYERLGFQLSTQERRGTPMHICLTDQIEITDKCFRQGDYKE